MIEDDDLVIFDSTIGFNRNMQFSMEITRLNKSDLEKIKQEILTNQKIKDSVLELWLKMLNDGIGGLPTRRESAIFVTLTNIIPKEMRDRKLDELRNE